VMTPNPVVVSPDTTLGEFMDKIMLSQRHTTYPVVDDGKPVGLLPFRCVANVPRGEWDVRRVRDCLISLDEVPVLREGERPRPRTRGEAAPRGACPRLAVRSGLLVRLGVFASAACRSYRGRRGGPCGVSARAPAGTMIGLIEPLRSP
jgi:hypothetical protein